ncbi:MAG: YjfB family protein [Lachnospiraceae bacterium]|nr:YjfB family protein [Lachnospiraceae bacterium]
MDIAALSMAMSQEKIMNEVGTAMLKNALNVQEDIGEEVVEMIDSAAMERSVNPSVGSVVDITV